MNECNGLIRDFASHAHMWYLRFLVITHSRNRHHDMTKSRNSHTSSHFVTRRPPGRGGPRPAPRRPTAVTPPPLPTPVTSSPASRPCHDRRPRRPYRSVDRCRPQSPCRLCSQPAVRRPSRHGQLSTVSRPVTVSCHVTRDTQRCHDVSDEEALECAAVMKVQEAVRGRSCKRT